MSDANSIVSDSSSTPAPAAAPSAQVSAAFTPAQLAAMADDLVVRGRLTREQADEALRADGVQPAPRPEPGSPEAIEAERVAELDRAFPRAGAHEFEFPRYEYAGSEDVRTPMPADMRKFDENARACLHELRFTKGQGSFVAKEIDKAAAATADMSEAEFALYAETERTKLQRIWGKDFNRKLGLVQGLVGELEERRPGAIEFMKMSGAGSTASVLVMLANQAEVLLDRAGGK